MEPRRALRVTAWILLGLVLAAPARAEEPDPEAALGEAWHLLEVERNPEEAVRRYEALSGTAYAASVRARALLGMARANRLLGRVEATERCLDEAFRLSPELGAVREAMGRTAPGAERTRYVTGSVRLEPGQGLDLDGGGVYSGRRTFTGGQVEIYDGAGGPTRPAGAADDASFARRVAVTGPRPWLRLVTDEGHKAWFQILVPGPNVLLRFVTRVAGTGPVLPEVRGAFCSGRDRAGGIEVHFEPTFEFTSYRIEMRRNTDGPFRPLGEVATPPFIHADATPGVRYAYRVTGLDATGNAGIPTELIGTTRSAGLVTGTLELKRGQAFDLLTGEQVADGGDLRLVVTYGGASAAGFVDARGGSVRPVAESPEAPRTLWDGLTASPKGYVEDGLRFVLPLRGGGIARGRLEMLPRARGEGAEARVHYEAQPDGIAFPPAPIVLTERAEGGVRVEVTGLSPSQRVSELTVHDLLRNTPPRAVALRAGPDSFLDDGVDMAAEPVLRYEATPVDDHGRRGATGSSVFDGRAPGVRTGSFRMHYEQGYSFLRGDVVPAAEADVVFSSCAGGISSIELSAPGGIVNLERSLHPPLLEDRRAGDPELLAEAVLGLDPKRVRLRREARGRERRPASDVFVLKLRDGGWARVFIVSRDEHADGGWQKQKATFRFAWNPRAPWFGEKETDGSEVARPDGFIVQPLEEVLARRRRELLGHLPSKPVTGSYAFHYRQGFSFETATVVDDPDDADVFFETCAGGISSITLTATGGIVNLSDLYGSRVAGEREALLNAILAIEDDQPLRRSHRARGDARTPADDVFLVRTRNGGYAKLAILARGKEGGWTDHLAQVRYAFNPHAAVFVEGEVSGVTRGPLRVRDEAANAFRTMPKAPAPTPTTSPRPSATPPAQAYLTPTDPAAPPPAPWLAPYRTERATPEAYDRLRTDLVRAPDDAFVVAGLAYLAGAHDPYYRRLAARALRGAYVLGVQGGEGAADALRRLARDPDPWTQYHALTMGQVFDTPLARELLLGHLEAPTSLPQGEAWSSVRDMIDRYAADYAERSDLDSLRAAGDEARAAWIAEAPTRPATEDGGRFTVVDLEEGKPYRWVLEPGDEAMGLPGRSIELTASGFHVERSPDGLVSADAATLEEVFGRGGRSAVGSATPYASGRGGTSGAMVESLMRVVGEGRLRLWRRPITE